MRDRILDPKQSLLSAVCIDPDAMKKKALRIKASLSSDGVSCSY